MIDEDKPPFFVQERYTDKDGNHLIGFNDRTQLYVGFSEGRVVVVMPPADPRPPVRNRVLMAIPQKTFVAA